MGIPHFSKLLLLFMNIYTGLKTSVIFTNMYNKTAISVCPVKRKNGKVTERKKK